MIECLSCALEGSFWPVHRLDKNVGGVMVYARSKAAAACLSACIQKGELVKDYVACVHGQPPEQGDWTDLLWKDTAKNKVYVVKRLRGGVKEARLSYCRLSGDQDRTFVRIRLHTGRSHQIRVQFASHGFPLYGDRKYGGHDDCLTPMLFSCGLSFPFAGKMHSYTAMPDWI